MITIQNIDRIKGSMWDFNDGMIFCTAVNEMNDNLILNRNSYTFDFEIGIEHVPLVIWFDRHKDKENNGYRMENNLVGGINYVHIEDVTTYDRFRFMLQDYLESIQTEIKKNFFN